ncbi:MAG TPA: hypothetical protein V6D28_30830 [Leptolyngbyaceae cyanobacterium]
MLAPLVSLAVTTMCSAPVAIELNVFSGLPNPTWYLSQSQCVELEQQIDKLPEIAKESLPPPPGLGYRGVVVHYVNQQGVRESIGFYRGTVRSQRLRLQDPNRFLEKWLLNIGQNFVDSNMQRYLQTELSQ